MNDLLAAALCYFGFHQFTPWKPVCVWVYEDTGSGPWARWVPKEPAARRRDCERCLVHQIEEVVE